MTEWRESTPDEINHFYREEFPNYLSRLPDHITADGPYQYAVSLRNKYPLHDSPIDTDFVRRNTKKELNDGDYGDPVFTDNTGMPSMDAVLDFIQAPATNDPHRSYKSDAALVDPADENLTEPIPEAVYYRLMNHDYGWVLMFDIDAKDIAAHRHQHNFEEGTGRDTILEESGVYDETPEGFPYSFDDIEQCLRYAFELREWVADALDMHQTLPVYSGQGAHLYVLDDAARQYTRQTREGIKNMIREGVDMGIPIDPVVTQTPDRLARMPYSLHTDVSRVCMPISSPDFDFRTEAVPEFLDE